MTEEKHVRKHAESMTESMIEIITEIMTEIIPFEKWFTFCKRLFIVKCFADVLNNIFRKLKKKKKKDQLAYFISKKL